MNEYDLLDAIGGIDPEYIKAAGTEVKRCKSMRYYMNFAMAAAGIILLVVAGAVIRNIRMMPGKESIDGTAETDGAVITEGSVEAEGAVIAEGTAETDGAVITDGSRDTDSAAVKVGSSETEEAATAENADYPAMLMYDGSLYKDSGEEFIGEVTEDGALQVSSYTDGEPKENGQQNFDRSCEVRFFVLNDETIAVRVEQTWKLFTKR